jgi:hypothetical protein
MRIETLDDLIESLTAIRDEQGTGDIRVRIAIQPTWPLNFSIGNVTMLSGDPDDDICEGSESCSDDEYDDVEKEKSVVWIATSDGHPWGENPYAPRQAWEDGF